MVSKRARPRPVYFETTVPVVRQHSCGVWLAAGVAEGIKAEIELIPLDLGQRLWCILNHVEMYALMRSGLVHMYRDRLADPKWQTWFPQHHCHISWPQPKKHWPSRPPGQAPIPF